MEQRRRNEWGLGEYDIDLTTLLKRAVGLAWNEKLGMLTIKGIGKQRRVHASDIFGDSDCGVILETRDHPNLLLYQDGEPTLVSDLMSRENHIVTVVPGTSVQGELDWRLQTPGASGSTSRPRVTMRPRRQASRAMPRTARAPSTSVSGLASARWACWPG
jgi:hypothetical protein